jgi:hypothetical protein
MMVGGSMQMVMGGKDGGMEMGRLEEGRGKKDVIDIMGTG